MMNNEQSYHENATTENSAQMNDDRIKSSLLSIRKSTHDRQSVVELQLLCTILRV